MYKRNDELKSDNITDENEGIVEYGNDFIISKVIHDGDSTFISRIRNIVKKTFQPKE